MNKEVFFQRNLNIYLIASVISLMSFGLSKIYKEAESVSYIETAISLFLFFSLGKIFSKKLSKINLLSSPVSSTALNWLFMSLIASIPIIFFKKDILMSYFDCVSQITSTGTSIIRQNTSSFSLNLWKHCICFIGGIFSISMIYALSENSNTNFSKKDSSFYLAMFLYFFIFLLSTFFIRISGETWFRSICYGMSNSSLTFSDFFYVAQENKTILKISLSIFNIISWISFIQFQQSKRKLFFSENIFSKKLYLATTIFFVTIVWITASMRHNHNSILSTLLDNTYTLIQWITGTGIDAASIKNWPIIVIFLLAIFTTVYKNETNQTGLGISEINHIRYFIKQEILSFLFPRRAMTLRKGVRNTTVSQMVLYTMAIILITAILIGLGQPIENSFLLTISSIKNMGISWDNNFLKFHSISHAQSMVLILSMWFGKIGLANLLLGIIRHKNKHYLETI